MCGFKVAIVVCFLWDFEVEIKHVKENLGTSFIKKCLVYFIQFSKQDFCYRNILTAALALTLSSLKPYQISLFWAEILFISLLLLWIFSVLHGL